MNDLVVRSKLFLKRNSSIILTLSASAGVVGTAVLTAKATPKVLTLLEQAKEAKGEDLTPLETIKVAAPAYIPATVAGIATIGCIFGIHGVNKRNQAALASAYGLLDNSYRSYREKVRELYGDDADSKVKEQVVKSIENPNIPPYERDKELFFDYYSGRYFNARLEDVLRAEYRINRTLMTREYAYINEFYEELGLPLLKHGWDIGWSLGGNNANYWQEWVDFINEKYTLDDGLEYYLVTMRQEPYENFADFA